MKRLDDLPPARAVVLDVTPRQLAEMAGDAMPRRYGNALSRYRYGPGVCKVDWALRGPVPWAAAGCRQAVTIHVGGGSERRSGGVERQHQYDDRQSPSNHRSQHRTGLAKDKSSALTGMLQGQRDLATVGRMLLSEFSPLVNAQQGVIYQMGSEDWRRRWFCCRRLPVTERTGSAAIENR